MTFYKSLVTPKPREGLFTKVWEPQNPEKDAFKKFGNPKTRRRTFFKSLGTPKPREGRFTKVWEPQNQEKDVLQMFWNPNNKEISTDCVYRN